MKSPETRFPVESTNAGPLDELHGQMVDELSQAVRARQLVRPLEPINVEHLRAADGELNRGRIGEGKRRVFEAHWGYWLIGCGMLLIGGFLVLTYLR